MQKCNGRILRLRRWLRRARRQLQTDHDDDVSLSDASGSDEWGHSSDACSVQSSSSGSRNSTASVSETDADAVSLPSTCFGSVTVSVVDSLGRPEQTTGHRSDSSSSSSATGSNDSSSSDGGHGHSTPALSAAPSPGVSAAPALLDRLLQSQLRRGASVPTAPPAPTDGPNVALPSHLGASAAWGGGTAGGRGSPLVYPASPASAMYSSAQHPSPAPMFPLLQAPAQQPLPPHLRSRLPADLQGPLSRNWG